MYEEIEDRPMFYVKKEVDAYLIILEAVSEIGVFTSKDLRDATGFKRDFVYNRIDDLVEDGYIEMIDNKIHKGEGGYKYKITNTGRLALSQWQKDEKDDNEIIKEELL